MHHKIKELLRSLWVKTICWFMSRERAMQRARFQQDGHQSAVIKVYFYASALLHSTVRTARMHFVIHGSSVTQGWRKNLAWKGHLCPSRSRRAPKVCWDKKDGF